MDDNDNWIDIFSDEERLLTAEFMALLMDAIAQQEPTPEFQAWWDEHKPSPDATFTIVGPMT